MSDKKKAVVYLIDSENVNDVWIQLVTVMQPQDEILVFYTEKSPHMSYEKVIELTSLSDRPIRWIKCVEGSNALDFQLVTELGARVAVSPDHAFVVVSNDTGFDAAVKYWVQRDKDVRRMKSTECKKLAQSLRAGMGASETEEAHTFTQVPESGQEDEELEPQYLTDIEQLGASIPISKLTLFHDAFVCMYDQTIGDEIYYYMKEHQEKFAYLAERYLPKKKARLKNYFFMALAHAGRDTEGTDAIMEIYHHIDEPKKNLQKLNVEAVKKFGQEQGTGYYKVLKKHVKIMSKL